ncbi:MAG: pantoate--beta-alanine ligase [Candidatus Binatus sp.]|jgi:pantoate--beta-alanine ligase|uniref:pantoate--beta-alanine ligase n=1 Tax=Candidatus Binatus sp. TaxID=2811406 RepID=UPI003D0DA1A6
MMVITSPGEMTRFAESARASGKRIALVPTMGFLHEGHLALMREGRRQSSVLVASIFVNPTQFCPGEDFARYPRNFKRDCAMLETAAVDVVFAPEPSAMYSTDAQTWVEAGEITSGLCGAHRPGHFRGVTTVVAKLFNIVKPHLAVFGEKDFQQLRAIQQMVRDLNFDVEIIPVPIVREKDGLAMSSRNAYLSPAEREDALALSLAIRAAREKHRAGACCAEEIVFAATRVLNRLKGVAIEYVEAVDAETLARHPSLDRPILIAIAARVGKTRLIDNAVLQP